MKRTIIALLICVNVGLLAALMWIESTPSAHAQGYAANNFAVVTGRLTGTNGDALYVLDLNNSLLLGMHVNPRGGVDVIPGVHDLKKEFAVRGAGVSE